METMISIPLWIWQATVMVALMQLALLISIGYWKLEEYYDKRDKA